MLLKVLTRLQTLVTIQLIAHALLDCIKVLLMLFGFCQLTQESKLSVQVSSLHAILKLG